jgi:hypothetical protein
MSSASQMENLDIAYQFAQNRELFRMCFLKIIIIIIIIILIINKI